LCTPPDPPSFIFPPCPRSLASTSPCMNELRNGVEASLSIICLHIYRRCPLTCWRRSIRSFRLLALSFTLTIVSSGGLLLGVPIEDVPVDKRKHLGFGFTSSVRAWDIRYA
jgi:hypothetical protein